MMRIFSFQLKMHFVSFLFFLSSLPELIMFFFTLVFCSFPSLDALGDADVDVLSDFREPTGEMKGAEGEMERGGGVSMFGMEGEEKKKRKEKEENLCHHSQLSSLHSTRVAVK